MTDKPKPKQRGFLLKSICQLSKWRHELSSTLSCENFMTYLFHLRAVVKQVCKGILSSSRGSSLTFCMVLVPFPKSMKLPGSSPSGSRSTQVMSGVDEEGDRLTREVECKEKALYF